METRDPRPSPPDLVPQDDVGLWMKLDSNPMIPQTDSQSAVLSEEPQAAPAVITRYYSVMDDEGADDVFIPAPPPPPPSLASVAPLLPTEGSTDANANNSSVTLSRKAADATEAVANPSSLDWHHGEKQLMATQVDKVTAQTSKQSTDTVSLSKDNNSNPATDQDPTSMDNTVRLMETCHDPTHHQDRKEGDSNDEPEDAVISDRQKNWSEAERDKRPSDTEENSENETHSVNERGKTKSEGICGLIDKDSNVMAEMSDCDAVDEDFKPCKTPEFQQTTSLSYNLTEDDGVRRESGTSESQALQHPMSDCSQEIVTKEEQGDGDWKLATDIQQGEQLLQRLQLVQQRQDVHMSESPLTPQQVVQETGGEEKDVPGAEADDVTVSEGDQEEQSRDHTVTGEGAQTDPREEENCGSRDTGAPISLSTMSERQHTSRTEAENSGDDPSDSWATHQMPTAKVLPARHRFSTAETSMEIQEAEQGKQNLQRAGAVFNLADDPDVLEIPFQTAILLEPFPANVSQDKLSQWQFSEQKMQKEISQEIQRELVLVNQGKIPGGYSKGAVRHLKETKQLFEAFQQVNTEGPTRHKKSPTLVMKGHVYPSVLERTRSLEMFPLKSCPIARAHSLRLHKSTTSEKSPENIRSRSPTGGSRDKTRLSPYPKQDKHLHVYRSMDSLSPDVSSSAVDTRSKTRQGNVRQVSAILKQNPFFKLRPALALQPEVEKDIREAREREEELRRQRCALYGENRQNSQEEEKSRFTATLVPDVRQQPTGKLERVWPPPSKKDQMKSGQTQQELRAHRAGGQKAPLWHRWESGLINGQPPQENN